MAIDKFVTAAAAAALIADGDTVALIGGGGGLCEATCLRGDRGALPRDPATRAAHRDPLARHRRPESRGMNRFAHEGW